MAELGVDTSSYPKPVAQPGLLDTVGKFQGLASSVQDYQYKQQVYPQALEQQKIGIDQTKLNLMNEHFKIANQELSTIADDPNITPEKLKVKLDNFAKTVNMPPPVYQHMLSEFAGLKTPDEIRNQAKLALTRGMSTQERINKVYGVPVEMGNNQQSQPGLQRYGQPPVPVGPPTQMQPPPTTPAIGPDGKPTLYGAQDPQLPPGAVAAPGGAPGQFIPQNRLPVAPPPMATPDASAAPPPVLNKNQDRVGSPPIVPRGPVTGFSPMFEAGKNLLAQDQATATQKLTAIKPALAALDLMKGLRSGPGTETWNKAVAFGKANNIIPIGANDPTAIYQEVNKYLNQYVQGAGTRSDADLAQRELSNANVTQQISPALEKLTRSTIAQDRIVAARPGAFEGGNKLEEYGKHSSQFPSKMDPRAFSIDKLDDGERQKLLGDMLKMKDSKNQSERKEALRFWQSLEVAKRSGVLGSN